MSVTTKFPEPTVVWHGPSDQPLVVLLHGRGPDAGDIIGLAEHLPADLTYVAVRAPIAEEGGFAWIANRGIGRPTADSLRATMRWFRNWPDDVADGTRPVCRRRPLISTAPRCSSPTAPRTP